jgi:hypothetical protein
MRFLFATLQYVESDFYGRVGRLLRARGHEVVHLTYSRRAALVLRRQGDEAYCLPDLMNRSVVEGSWRGEESRIVGHYPISSLHEVYRTDPPCRMNEDESWCVERTIRHFLAIEGLMDRVKPDFVVPEVGNESIRTVTHLVGAARGATTYFLLYTLFDDPLRLYENTMDAPIVTEDELRPLDADERRELDAFVARYEARDEPIREYRSVPLRPDRLRILARHLAVRARWDRDNDYLKPGSWLLRDAREKVRARVLRSLYSPGPGARPFVYFPLQVTDDYKIIRLRPHCVHQDSIVRQLAAALPPGVDLVIKEHPMAIGRSSFRALRDLTRIPNVSLVEPHTSSLGLIRRASAVVTISSTVGLEATMLGKPVMTIGRPFYAGFGITIDVDGLVQVPERLPDLFSFAPDRERVRRFLNAAMKRCHPGAPVLVDRTDKNAVELARTLDAAASGRLADPLARRRATSDWLRGDGYIPASDA